MARLFSDTGVPGEAFILAALMANGGTIRFPAEFLTLVRPALRDGTIHVEQKDDGGEIVLSVSIAQPAYR